MTSTILSKSTFHTILTVGTIFAWHANPTLSSTAPVSRLAPQDLTVRTASNDLPNLTLAFVSKTNRFLKRPTQSYFKKALYNLNMNSSAAYYNRYKLTYVYQDDFNKYSPSEAFSILCDKVSQ